MALVTENKALMLYAHNRYARGSDPEDIMQEMLLRAWKNFPNFKNQSKFSTWFHNLCRNVCIDYLRKKSNDPKIISFPGDIPDRPYVDDVSEKKRLEKIYQTAINSLHPIERRYFKMYLDGLSFKQMEHLTEVDQNTMRVRIHRIKERLAKKFKVHEW